MTQGKFGQASEWPRLYKFIILLILVSLFWYPIMYLIVPSFPFHGRSEISTALIEGNEITGESGSSITTIESESSNRVILLNETPFKSGYDWYVAYGFDDPPGSVYSMVDDGILVQFEPTHYFGNNPHLSFRHIFYISSLDTTEISISVNGKGLKGNVNLKLEVFFDFNRPQMLIQKNVTSEPNLQFVLAESSLILGPQPESNELLTLVSLRLEVWGPALSEVLIESVVVIVESDQNLCRLTIDYLDTLGNSILANELGSRTSVTPRIIFSGGGFSSQIFFSYFNQTLYLREGNYSLEEIYHIGNGMSSQQLNVSLHQNKTTWIGIYHQFARLYFDIQPSIPSMRILIYVNGYYPLYRATEPLVHPSPDFVYLPPGRMYFAVELRSDNEWDFHGTFHASSSEYSGRGINWTLQIRADMRIWGNMAIPDILVLPLVLLPILFALSLTLLFSDTSAGRIRKFWKSPHFYPTLLLFSSVLFPWAALKTSDGWSFVYYLPLLTDLVSVSSSLEVFSLTRIGEYLAFGGGFIFWAVAGSAIVLSLIQFKKRELLFAVLFSVSFFLSLWVIMQSMLLAVTIGVGVVVSLAAFPLWLCLKTVIHLRNRSSPSSFSGGS